MVSFMHFRWLSKGHPNQKGGCPDTLDTPWIRPWLGGGLENWKILGECSTSDDSSTAASAGAWRAPRDAVSDLTTKVIGLHSNVPASQHYRPVSGVGAL